ncbi:hypothetical protein Acr_00g0047480 [Actinidia rufa]|uniref:DNAse I-like superfamily protein n=1 Tax=Actinidia rufa TaxID=165716 RepID=A0A7J0DKD7_9ERIC|nr:hypothetical protein Acr_00g0047480 [Actinidia rufa]
MACIGAVMLLESVDGDMSDLTGVKCDLTGGRTIRMVVVRFWRALISFFVCGVVVVGVLHVRTWICIFYAILKAGSSTKYEPICLREYEFRVFSSCENPVVVSLPSWVEYSDFQLNSSRMVEDFVKYPWKPLKCGKCRTFGHVEGNYVVGNGIPNHRVQEQVWIVKYKGTVGQDKLNVSVGQVESVGVDTQGVPFGFEVVVSGTVDLCDIQGGSSEDTGLITVHGSSSLGIGGLGFTSNKFDFWKQAVASSAAVEICCSDSVNVTASAGNMIVSFASVIENTELFLDHKLSIMGLVETKVRQQNLNATVKHCLPSGWDSIHTIGDGVVAILFFWNAQLCKTTHIASRTQQITYHVEHVVFEAVPCDYCVWRVDMDYFDHVAVAQFNASAEDGRIDDMTAKGFFFTWSNRDGGMGDKKCRIDRAMVNRKWQDCFPESEAVFAAPGLSDHSPIIVTILPSSSHRRPFKFFNFWMNNSCLAELLRNSCKNNYSDISNKVIEGKAELTTLQELCSNNPVNPGNALLEREALLKYIELSNADESFKKQKSTRRVGHYNMQDLIVSKVPEDLTGILIMTVSANENWEVVGSDVIMDVQSFFSPQVFYFKTLVPKTRILEEVECMLKAFLWTGATLRNSGAKVQRALVCSPKNEGGFQVDSRPVGWFQVRDWAVHNLSSNSFAAALLKLVLWATVYHVWRERNACIFSSNTAKGGNVVFKTIASQRIDVAPRGWWRIHIPIGFYAFPRSPY